jgi:endonuclease G, mitochondrial
VSRRRRQRQSSGFAFVLAVLLGVLLLRCLASPSARKAESPARERVSAEGAPDRNVRGDTARRAGFPLPPSGVAVPVASSRHVLLGVPTDADPSDDYLMDEHAFVLSYNPKRRVPNWVAWELSQSDLGRASRMNDFRSEDALPANFYHVSPRDYEHSGYDRGHLCPSADRTENEDVNATTFLMVNMVPQRHELNTGPWERLEKYERHAVGRRGTELLIVAGGIFEDSPQTIGNGVQVPKSNFKIIVALDDGATARDVTESTSVLAVIMPNEADVGGRDFREFVTSVDRVEAETGYDFLPAVSEGVQRVIEARVSTPPPDAERRRGGRESADRL